MTGKKIGATLYIHKNYTNTLDEETTKSLKEIECEHEELYNSLMNKCSILKLEKKNITFIECVNFDSSLNPIIKKWYKFTLNDNNTWVYSGIKTNSAVNPLILHKKELMVGKDYKGFSVELAKKWDDILFSSGIQEFSSKNKIGRMKYWKTCISKFVDTNKDMYNNFIEEWEKQFKTA